MVHITKEELDNLEVVGSGMFGRVYKKDDKTAYKIYHSTVKNYMGLPMDNPALTTTRLHYKLLLARKDFIKRSKLIQDLVYMPCGFMGVVIPYYEGDTISSEKLSLDTRIKLSKELVNKGKELNEYLIYPTDYKLNNMLHCNGHLKLIDLDDTRTHAFIYPSPLFRLFSVSSLGETVQDMLGQYDHSAVKKEEIEQLKRIKGFYATSYRKIEEYIKNKEKELVIFFIDRNTDLYEICRYNYLYRYPVVYIFDRDENISQVLNSLRLHGIQLYDLVSKTSFNKYPDVENVKESYTYEDDHFTRVYKKR